MKTNRDKWPKKIWIEQPTSHTMASDDSGYLIFTIQGVEILTLPIGKAAVEVQRHKQTLRNWTRGGVIPQPFTDENGNRWFSEAYTKFLRRVIIVHRDKKWDLAFFKERVWASFADDPTIPEHAVNQGVNDNATQENAEENIEKDRPSADAGN